MDKTLEELWQLYMSAVKEESPKPKLQLENELKLIKGIIKSKYDSRPSDLVQLWVKIIEPIDLEDARKQQNAKLKKRYSHYDIESAYEQAGYLERFLFERHVNDMRTWRKNK